MTRIVLIGGGYTTFGAWKVLRRSLRRQLAQGRVSVTIVSAQPYHYFHGFIGEMIGGVVSVAAGMSAARSIFAGARFITGTVTRVDAETRTVAVVAAGASTEVLLDYDHLVVGLGARYRRDAVPGLDTFGWALRDIGAIQGFRNHLIACFERAEASTSDADARRALTIVVAGGGFAGVEVTAALGELVAVMRRHYTVLRRIRPRLVLVHSGRRILAEMAAYPKVVAYAETHLARYGVEVLAGTRVTRVERGRVVLSTGEAIASDTVLSTIGNAVTPLPGLTHFSVDPQGRLRTNAQLQLVAAPEIWCGGDCANVPRAGHDASCPTNALWATRQGEHIGRNLARSVRGRRPAPFTYRGFGVAASMGTGKGMGEVFGVAMTGWPAWVLRLLVFLWFVPSRRQAFAALVEHLKLPLCGRGLVPVDTIVPAGLMGLTRTAPATGSEWPAGRGDRSAAVPRRYWPPAPHCQPDSSRR